MPATIALEELQSLFGMPLADAAKQVGVSQTYMKKVCRLHGITRWPFRKIRADSLKAIKEVEAMALSKSWVRRLERLDMRCEEALIESAQVLTEAMKECAEIDAASATDCAEGMRSHSVYDTSVSLQKHPKTKLTVTHSTRVSSRHTNTFQTNSWSPELHGSRPTRACCPTVTLTVRSSAGGEDDAVPWSLPDSTIGGSMSSSYQNAHSSEAISPDPSVSTLGACSDEEVFEEITSKMCWSAPPPVQMQLMPPRASVPEHRIANWGPTDLHMHEVPGESSAREQHQQRDVEEEVYFDMADFLADDQGDKFAKPQFHSDTEAAVHNTKQLPYAL